MTHEFLAAPQRELELLIRLPFATDDIVAKSIADRQWLTAHIIAEHEPTFEVERPYLVRSRRLCQVLRSHTMHAWLTLTLFDQSTTT